VNLELLLPRFQRIGYRLRSPESALLPPAEAHLFKKLERAAGGPLPLSIAAFWEFMAGVDLTQDHTQTAHDWLLDDGHAPPDPVALLGDDDPLQVISLGVVCSRLHERPQLDGRLYIFLAPDCFHKAGVSGGENYHLLLPEDGPDFRIIGDVSPENDPDWSRYGGGQWFVSAIRRSMAGGGFRGRLDVEAQDRWSPWRPVHEELAKDLLPI